MVLCSESACVHRIAIGTSREPCVFREQNRSALLGLA